MLGRTPGHIVAIRPLKDGVIADFKVTEKMLNYFIQKAHNRKMLVHPRIVIGVPAEITQVERRAVMDSAYRAKASEVYLVDQAMVAAIGAGLPTGEPTGSMIIDIGGGTTDIAVISLNGIVYSRSVRMAGNQMDEAIMTYVKRKYNLLIGERTLGHKCGSFVTHRLEMDLSGFRSDHELPGSYRYYFIEFTRSLIAFRRFRPQKAIRLCGEASAVWGRTFSSSWVLGQTPVVCA